MTCPLHQWLAACAVPACRISPHGSPIGSPEDMQRKAPWAGSAREPTSAGTQKVTSAARTTMTCRNVLAGKWGKGTGGTPVAPDSQNLGL